MNLILFEHIKCRLIANFVFRLARWRHDSKTELIAINILYNTYVYSATMILKYRFFSTAV